jgi:hypothetical protein
MQESNRSPVSVFALVLTLSLAIRLVALWFVGDAPLASDSGDYRGMALQLLSGVRFVPYWPPGMSLFLAPLIAAGAGTAVLRASMLLWWVVFCFGFARLAGDLAVPRRLWLAALAIFGITPALVHFSIEPMTPMPAAVLLLWALSATVRCTKGAGWGEALLLGFTLGYLSLVRPSALPLAIVLPAIVIWRRRSVAIAAIVLAVAGVMLFAWMARVHEMSGRWTLNNSNGANAYYGNNPWTPLYRTWYFGSHAKLRSDEIQQYPEYERIVRGTTLLPIVDRSKAFENLAKDYVLHHPGAFLLRTANRVRCFWGFDIFTAANLRSSTSGKPWFPVAFVLDAACYLIIAACAFFWIAAASGSLWRRWEAWLLAGAIVLYALPYWVTMSHPTYHFPVLAPLALLGLLAKKQGIISRARGWTAVAGLAIIQVEWIYFLTKN